MRHPTLALLAALLGCGPATRDCPAPIGPIVLEDCAVYARRLEKLQVSVGVVIGGVNTQAAVQREALRGPSEAFEVLAHRLHGLCQDHNACRLPGPAHQAQRASLDQQLTTLSGLVTRYEASEDDAERGRIKGEVEAALQQASGVEVALKRQHYRSYLPWLGARLLPPPPEGPFVIQHSYDVQRSWLREHSAWRPRIRLDLYQRGGFDKDDAVQVTWPDDSVSEAPLHARGNGPDHATITLEAPKTSAYTALQIGPARVALRRGATGEELPLGERPAEVVLTHPGDPSNPKDDRWGVDRDPLLAHAWLQFHPEGGALPALEGERPALSAVLRLRAYTKASLRCAVDGQDAFGALGNGRYGGQVDLWQDQERWERVAPGKSVAVRHPHIQWWRVSFLLPFLHAAPDLPEGDRTWPLAGAWDCRITADGETLRRVRFTVGADGRPAGITPEAGRWPLPTERLANPLEVPTPSEAHP